MRNSKLKNISVFDVRDSEVRTKKKKKSILHTILFALYIHARNPHHKITKIYIVACSTTHSKRRASGVFMTVTTVVVVVVGGESDGDVMQVSLFSPRIYNPTGPFSYTWQELPHPVLL